MCAGPRPVLTSAQWKHVVIRVGIFAEGPLLSLLARRYTWLSFRTQYRDGTSFSAWFCFARFYRLICSFLVCLSHFIFQTQTLGPLFKFPLTMFGPVQYSISFTSLEKSLPEPSELLECGLLALRVSWGSLHHHSRTPLTYSLCRNSHVLLSLGFQSHVGGTSLPIASRERKTWR